MRRHLLFSMAVVVCLVVSVGVRGEGEGSGEPAAGPVVGGVAEAVWEKMFAGTPAAGGPYYTLHFLWIDQEKFDLGAIGKVETIEEFLEALMAQDANMREVLLLSAGPTRWGATCFVSPEVGTTLVWKSNSRKGDAFVVDAAVTHGKVCIEPESEWEGPWCEMRTGLELEVAVPRVTFQGASEAIEGPADEELYKQFDAELKAAKSKQEEREVWERWGKIWGERATLIVRRNFRHILLLTQQETLPGMEEEGTTG